MGFSVRSKIWIENEEGKLIMGSGRLRILEAIKETGSMNKAAKKLKQPFRAVWGKIKATEERCGFTVVKTTQSGSELTPEGNRLLSMYLEMRDGCEDFTDKRFKEIFSGFLPIGSEPEIPDK
jgi:molybdate transport system regulatory protein